MKASSTDGNAWRGRDIYLPLPRLKMVNGVWMCKVVNPYGLTPFVGVATTPLDAFNALKDSIIFRLKSKGYGRVEFCDV